MPLFMYNTIQQSVGAPIQITLTNFELDSCLYFKFYTNVYLDTDSYIIKLFLTIYIVLVYIHFKSGRFMLEKFVLRENNTLARRSSDSILIHTMFMFTFRESLHSLVTANRLLPSF